MYEKEFAALEKAHDLLQQRVEFMEKNISELLPEIQKDVRELRDVMNKGKGAYAASMMLAGVIGGAVVKLAAMLVKPD